MRTRLLLTSTALLATTPCLAGPFDFYGGAGVGQATLRQDYYQVDAHTTGWKLFAGWRPLDAFGAEVEYANLGSKDVTYQSSYTTHVSTDAHASALFGVGYLPVPLPFIDLYGKAGVARVQSNTSASFNCLSTCVLPPPVTDDSNHTSFAWGAGIQARFGIPAVRLDYERFNGSQGTDALITVSVTANL